MSNAHTPLYYLRVAATYHAKARMRLLNCCKRPCLDPSLSTLKAVRGSLRSCILQRLALDLSLNTPAEELVEVVNTYLK